jgi:MFS family permease
MTGRQFTRRRSIQAFFRNGAYWGLGNGLVSSSLIVYFAGTFGAVGFTISLILAMPRLVGVLRLGTPIFIDAIGRRQQFCVRMFLAASIVLMLLPAVALLPSLIWSLWAMVALWTTYHLLEFLGLVALWSWIGDVVPDAIRGRFIGRRGALLNACQVAGMLLGGGGSWWWRGYCVEIHREELIWLAYAVCAVVGAMLLALAVWPLAKAPVDLTPKETIPVNRRQRLREIIAPFADRDYRRFLAYGGWFSLANGISGLALFLFQMRVLDISYGGRMAMDGTSQGVQSLIMPSVGKAIDRWGGVPVLVISQLLVALGLLFFLIATPEAWWWILGAYLLWIAYAGVNTAMPKLMLSLAPPTHYTSYSAAWFAWSELVFALSALAGGLLFDWASDDKNFTPQVWAGYRVDHFAAIFLLGLVLRLSAAAWAARIREPTGSKR